MLKVSPAIAIGLYYMLKVSPAIAIGVKKGICIINSPEIKCVHIAMEVCTGSMYWDFSKCKEFTLRQIIHTFVSVALLKPRIFLGYCIACCI